MNGQAVIVFLQSDCALEVDVLSTNHVRYRLPLSSGGGCQYHDFVPPHERRCTIQAIHQVRPQDVDRAVGVSCGVLGECVDSTKVWRRI